MNKLGFAVLLFSLASAEAIAGSLAGQTVRVTGERYEMGTVEVGPEDVVVGAGLEIPGNFWGIYTINLSDTNILFTVPGSCCGGFTGGTFNGIHFRDLNGSIGAFESVTIAVNTVAGFDSSRITLDADNIYVNFQGLNPDPQTSVLSLDLTISDAPEPSAFFLLAAGVATMTAARRRFISRP